MLLLDYKMVRYGDVYMPIKKIEINMLSDPAIVSAYTRKLVIYRLQFMKLGMVLKQIDERKNT